MTYEEAQQHAVNAQDHWLSAACDYALRNNQIELHKNLKSRLVSLRDSRNLGSNAALMEIAYWLERIDTLDVPLAATDVQ